jgi:hypothetical protein
VVSFAAQPFWLSWSGTGRARSHAPDFFARTLEGTGVVIDCRPADRVRPRDAEAFAVTERACAEVGWQYRLVTGHDATWLAGSRHRRHRRAELEALLLKAFATPRPLDTGVASVADPIAVLPVVFHLLWTGILRADLTRRFDATMLVSAVTG